MPDLDRAAAMRLLYRKIADPNFRRRLAVRKSDGARPLAVVLREDPMSHLLEQLQAHEWAVNIAVPTLNGLLILACVAEPSDMDIEGVESGEPVRLSTGCTAGVFLQRLEMDLLVDRRAAYEFEVSAPGGPVQRGRAELVGMAG